MQHDAVLKQAGWVGKSLVGKVYEDKKKRFEDGTEIFTTEVTQISGDLYKTKNTIYKVEFFKKDWALREKTSAERKLEPIHAGVLRYFPDALAAISRVSKAGNDKHNPGEPLHWSRGKSNDHLDCVTRHVVTPYESDPETKEFHLAHAAWRVLAALQLAEEKKLIEAGIKPLSGIVECTKE
jgi:hypothetical protein